MRFSAIVGEASRNLMTGTSRLATFVLAVAATLTALVILDASAVMSLRDEAYEFERIGGNTYVAALDGGIDGAWCDALSSLPEVTHAGAVSVDEGRTSIDRLPDSPVPMTDSTIGLLSVLRTAYDGSATGLLASDDVATSLQLRAGGSLRTTAQEVVPVAGTFPSDDRGPRFEFTTININPARARFDECWFSTLSNVESSVGRLAVSADADSLRLTTEVINPTVGSSSNSVDRYDNRSSRFNPLGGAGLSALLGIAFVQRRRIQLASALQLGVKRSALVAILTLESAAISATATSMASAACLVGLNRSFQLETLAMTSILLTNAASSFAGLFAGVLVGIVMVRRTSYYRYFRAG